MNIQELKKAEADYWIEEFLKFAAKIGQRVEMATVSNAIESSENRRIALLINMIESDTV